MKTKKHLSELTPTDYLRIDSEEEWTFAAKNLSRIKNDFTKGNKLNFDINNQFIAHKNFPIYIYSSLDLGCDEIPFLNEYRVKDFMIDVDLKSAKDLILDNRDKKTPSHYDNTYGSLYKIAQERGWNSYEFDIVKRITRCRKKGEFIQDLEKTKNLIDIYLKEQICNFQ